ncbi:MAG: hypothetical protein QOE70_4386 [Chthoniobacter sp.]|jgi:hypothetical protein|nr:hypothetical protein [Chthoniobacter sp.]
MSDQTVRTTFVWDTNSVEKGAQTYEKAMDRVHGAGKGNGNGRGGIPGGSANLIQGVKDLAEGRTMFGVHRLSHAIGGIGVTAGFAAAGIAAVGAAMHRLNKDTEAANKAGERLAQTFQGSSRDATFASAADGPQALGRKAQDSLNQINGEREQQGKLQDTARLRDSNPVWQGVGKFYDNAIAGVRQSDFMTGLFGEQKNPKQLQQESEMREKGSAKDFAKLRGLGEESYAHQASAARFNAPGAENNPFEARRAELALQEKQEDLAARELHMSDKSLALIKERYSWLRKGVAAEEALAKSRHESQSRELTIQGSARSGFQKSLATSQERQAQSRDLLASGNLTTAQQRAEGLNLQRAENEERETLMGRYLNPDGTRRRAGEINRDIRADRRGERLRGRFLKNLANGAIDPVTGRRRTTVGGLHSERTDFAKEQAFHIDTKRHGLGLDGDDPAWRALFPRKDRPAAAAAPALDVTKHKSAADIWDILNKRLPATMNGGRN